MVFFETEKSEYYKVDPANPSKEVYSRAAELIESGGLIVYPTDTLYGFGVNINNPVAMNRLIEVKGQQSKKPISMMVRDIPMIESLIGKLNDQEKTAVRRLFPGKITILLPVRKTIKNSYLKQFKKLGFRIPDNLFCHHMMKKLNSPVSTTSVNRTHMPNLTDAAQISKLFEDDVDMIIDGGEIISAAGSSIIDFSFYPPEIIRQGDMTVDEIERRLGYSVSTNFSGKFVVTFVCSGNICRSPMAEGILLKAFEKTRHRKSVQVNSAATLDLQPRPAHHHAITVCEQYGINLHDHLSQRVSSQVIREANIVICMALNHFQYLRGKYPEFKSKIVLLKQWKNEKKLLNPSVADPIGLDKEVFEATAEEIQKEITRILPALVKEIRNFSQHSKI